MTAQRGEELDDDHPRDLAAERSVLGACMLDADAVAAASNFITAADFYRPAHAHLFKLLLELFEAGRPTDPVNVASLLDQRGELLRIGGAPYLHDLYAEAITASNVTYWAETVADRSGRSRLLDASVHLRQLVRDPSPTSEVQERAREIVEEATTARVLADGDDGVWLADAIDDHIADWDDDDEPTVPIPYADFHDVTGGWRPGQLIVVAARPGVGKSVFGTDCARHAAQHGEAVLIVSLEMSRRDVMNRLICAQGKVRLANVQSGILGDHDRDRIEDARKVLRDLPIRIEDRFSTSLARLRSMAREAARSDRGLGLIVVDYLQLLTPADPRMQRREQVDAFSRGLKSLAKELSVPVIALAQLNRGPESRTDKKPLMSDLRESGSIEQDADIVVLLHRPDVLERDDPRAGEADFVMAKHRNGPTATITVAHQLHFARFTDIARG